jgi:hypothetical protein
VALAAATGIVAVFTPVGAFAGALLGLMGAIVVVVSRVIKVPPPQPATDP